MRFTAAPAPNVWVSANKTLQKKKFKNTQPNKKPKPHDKPKVFLKRDGKNVCQDHSFT